MFGGFGGGGMVAGFWVWFLLWVSCCGCRGMELRLVFGGGGMVARLVFVVTGVWIGAMI